MSEGTLSHVEACIIHNVRKWPLYPVHTTKAKISLCSLIRVFSVHRYFLQYLLILIVQIRHFLHANMLWYSLEVPHPCTSNEYHKVCFHEDTEKYFVDTLSYLEFADTLS